MPGRPVCRWRWNVIDLFAEYYAECGKDIPAQQADAGILVHLGDRWLLFASGGSQLFHPGHFFLSTGFAIDIFTL